MAYTKQTWTDGDIITSEKLNHMEDGIAEGGSGGGGLTNFVNGTPPGSARGVSTMPDPEAYTMGLSAFAEGSGTKASGSSSHAEGANTESSGAASHVEGYESIAKGSYSHAEGVNTIASYEAQHTQGRFNVEDSSGIYAFIIGNGSNTNRSNAFAIKWDGTIVVWNNGTAVELTPAKLAALLATLNS